MKKDYNKLNNVWQKGKMGLSLLAVTFFFFIIFPINSHSAGFRYADFDWDKFKEQKKTFWSSYCVNNADSTCEDKILSAQEKFYKKLYKALAKYEENGLFINDNVILETVFLDMTPSTFTDDGEAYANEWNTGSGAYAVTDGEVTNEELDIKYTEDYYQKYGQYFADEKDTLILLLQNMIAYPVNCYGIYGDPTVHTRDDGSSYKSCDNGGVVANLPIANTSTGIIGGEKCVDSLLSYKYGLWEFYTSRWANDYTISRKRIIPFLKRNTTDSRYEECVNLGSSYPEKSLYVYNNHSEVSYDRYFDFLSYNIYFDKKAHLQSRFKETVLEPAGVDCMTEDLCDNSLEAAGKYDEYEGEIIIVRRKIIDDIIFILNNYGIEITYNYDGSEEYVQENIEESIRRGYYWIIGSDKTEVRDRVIYADGDPESTEVVSYYGVRTNQVTGKSEMNYGIDIAGIEGETNVIAAYNGEVISIVDNCTVGDYDCNEGLGNAIIISHANGDYTVYAQLASIDSTIQVGTGVKKGQLIGQVGKTGRTNTPALHYELRKGGNDISFAVDPLSEMDINNPRPVASNGDFSVHKTSLTKEEFVAKLRAYCNSGACKNTMQNVFVAHAEEIYTVSIANNVNPELVIVRASNEGFSPGGSTNNYWGIRCYNGAGVDACSKYSSLSAGIAGFANVVKNYEYASDMMSRYAYIGSNWFNPGSWSNGGCVYFPYISKYMSSSRSYIVSAACNGVKCEGSACLKTTDEDQRAYATWQVNDKMVPLRYNIFGL